MTVRELVEVLRNHGLLPEEANQPDFAVNNALALLSGAYGVSADDYTVDKYHESDL